VTDPGAAPGEEPPGHLREPNYAEPGRRAVADPVRVMAESGRPRRYARDGLTVEQAAAIESPREFRLSPDGRRLAFTAESAGARQIFLMPVRGGYPEQLTATEKAVSDPQWSPDGRRIAFVREEAIWMIDVEGSHQALVTQHPAGNRSPRWCADGHQIGFISRRRGWDQLWVVDAPVPRRGRPAARPRSPEPTALTETGVDIDEFVWSPDGRRLAVTSQRLPDLLTMQIHVVDVATGRASLVAGELAWETGPRWLPDGSGLLMVSDEDGWFQVVRVSTDGRDRTVLTAGRREHGEPSGGWGYLPLVSPDGKRFVHIEVRDGLIDLLVGDLPDGGAEAPPVEGKRPAVVSPFDGVWMAVGWLPDSSAILALGSSERSPDDLWLLPMPEAAAEGVKPRQLTRSLPIVVDTARFSAGTRIAFQARDGLSIEGTLYLPPSAVGEEATRVPCLVHSHGGPTHQAFRDWLPFRQLVVESGIAFLSVDFRGSTGYGREFRWANRGEWGHADTFDVVDAAHWAAAQPWCDGRLAHYGASYGGYMTLSVLTEENVPIVYTGLRAGERLHESLFHDHETTDRTGHPSIMRVRASAIGTVGKPLQELLGDLVAATQDHDDIRVRDLLRRVASLGKVPVV